jgi:hypothetical protein
MAAASADGFAVWETERIMQAGNRELSGQEGQA